MWLNLDAVIAAAPSVRPAPRVGTQPLAKEDIAVVVDRGVAAEDGTHIQGKSDGGAHAQTGRIETPDEQQGVARAASRRAG